MAKLARYPFHGQDTPRDLPTTGIPHGTPLVLPCRPGSRHRKSQARFPIFLLFLVRRLDIDWLRLAYRRDTPLDICRSLFSLSFSFSSPSQCTVHRCNRLSLKRRDFDRATQRETDRIEIARITTSKRRGPLLCQRFSKVFFGRNLAAALGNAQLHGQFVSSYCPARNFV